MKPHSEPNRNNKPDKPYLQGQFSTLFGPRIRPKRRRCAFLDCEITIKFDRAWRKQLHTLARAYGTDFSRFVISAILTKMDGARSALGLYHGQELKLTRPQIKALRTRSRLADSILHGVQKLN